MALGEPCAGKPLARFDEGEPGLRVLYSTKLEKKIVHLPGERSVKRNTGRDAGATTEERTASGASLRARGVGECETD